MGFIVELCGKFEGVPGGEFKCEGTFLFIDGKTSKPSIFNGCDAGDAGDEGGVSDKPLSVSCLSPAIGSIHGLSPPHFIL